MLYLHEFKGNKFGTPLFSFSGRLDIQLSKKKDYKSNSKIIMIIICINTEYFKIYYLSLHIPAVCWNLYTGKTCIAC